MTVVVQKFATQPVRPEDRLRPDLQAIADLIPVGSRVLDLGCGDGALLDALQRTKQVRGRGIELSEEGVLACVRRGLSVRQGDLQEGMADYPDGSFDVVILAQTLPFLDNPALILNEIARVGDHAIISLPNWGYWRCRLDLLLTGRFPQAPDLRQAWFETPRRQPLTVTDFAQFCERIGMKIEREFYLARGRRIEIRKFKNLPRHHGGLQFEARVESRTKTIMSLHVHLLSVYSSIGTEPLRERLHPLIRLTEGAEVIDPESVEVLIGGFPEAHHLDDCPRLRALIVPFAGAPVETYTLLRNYPKVTLHSLHYNAIPTAEMAVALLLSAAKLIVPLDRDLRRGDWSARYTVTPVIRLDGKTALVLGFGQIGRRIARACRGMGMDVIGVRRGVATATVEEGVEVHPTTALHDLLPRTDALLLALPETPETTGIIGARELALLRTGAIVVNVGRGPTLDEEALYNALCNGSLRAAGIDVWYEYPQAQEARTNTRPSRFPFHQLDNVVMSPHRAGWLSEAEIERMEGLALMLNAAAAGEPIPSLVDKALGY